MFKYIPLTYLLLILFVPMAYANGHQATADWWNAVLKIQSDLETLLTQVKDQSEQRAKEDRTTKTTAFQTLLGETLPGAEISSARGSGFIALTNNGRADFEQLTQITTITQNKDTLTRRFYLKGNKNPYNFSVTDGTNTAHVMVNAEIPSHSRFVSVVIPALNTSEKKATQMANDVYMGYVAESEGLGINQLAEILLLKPEAQKALLETSHEVATAAIVDPAEGVVAPKPARPRSLFDQMFNILCIIAVLIGFLLIQKFRTKKSAAKTFKPRPSVPVTPSAYGFLNNFCQDCGNFRPGPDGQCLDFSQCTVRLGQQHRPSYVHSPAPQMTKPEAATESTIKN